MSDMLEEESGLLGGEESTSRGSSSSSFATHCVCKAEALVGKKKQLVKMPLMTKNDDILSDILGELAAHSFNVFSFEYSLCFLSCAPPPVPYKSPVRRNWPGH